jgi:hypothetical protein
MDASKITLHAAEQALQFVQQPNWALCALNRSITRNFKCSRVPLGTHSARRLPPKTPLATPFSPAMLLTNDPANHWPQQVWTRLHALTHIALVANSMHYSTHPTHASTDLCSVLVSPSKNLQPIPGLMHYLDVRT